MRITSWNVNGLRAVHKNGHWEAFTKHDWDIIGLQETKATPEQLPLEVREIPGYYSYFTHPTLKKGYSGVALYSKIEPKKVEYGLGIEALDQEGRLITAYYKDFVLLTVYFPNGGGAPERFEYKLDFYDAFLLHVDTLHSKGHKVIFCGDINAAHEPIDLANPKSNEGTPGYRPEVREWIDEVLRHGYVDTFRHFNPTAVSYSYWDLKTRARDRNIGWRIDYFFVSNDLLKKVTNTEIHPGIYGSDHCPVSIDLEVSL